MAYDPSRRATLLFGGSGDAGDARVWEWDGASGTWLDRTRTPMPRAWPVTRDSPGMVRDAGRGRIIMFGGFRITHLRELWQWIGDGLLWSDMMPLLPSGAWPPARAGHAMAYDARRRAVVVFAGQDENWKPLDDVWELPSP